MPGSDLKRLVSRIPEVDADRDRDRRREPERRHLPADPDRVGVAVGVADVDRRPQAALSAWRR